MKLKANGQVYDLPQRPASLGEARLIKKEFGVVFGRDEVDLFDPDWAAAFLYRAMREADKNLTPKQAIALVNEVNELDFVNDDGSEITEEDEAPPTVEAPTEPTPEKAEETPGESKTGK